MITDTTTFALTSEQRAAVTRPWDAKTLVTARAGTGKTTTLMYRLEHLTCVEELLAADVLALTFSRAAVRELRARVDRSASSARLVRAQTFDGWAYSLLLQAGHERESLARMSFDQRIEAATQAIDDGVLEASEFGAPAHVVIDEVQDLVGVRREMVETLLDRYARDVGFTVVGDVAQSIYGFQVSDPDERSGEANRFVDWLQATFGEELDEVLLEQNFRARTKEAGIALRYGPRIGDLSAAREEADRAAALLHGELCAVLAKTPAFGDLDNSFVQESLRHFDGTTAILCRDNGQVLFLAEELNRAGVPHRIQSSPSSRPVPPWVGKLLVATEAAMLTEERFAGILSTLELPDTADDSARLWRSLRRVASGARNQLDLHALRSAVGDGRLPDELTVPDGHPLVLSTIHRAKGLEFDRVLVVEPEPLTNRRGNVLVDPQAEARLLYVAMTRPRDDVYRMPKPNTWWLRKTKTPLDRWYATGRESWMRTGIEMADVDVCHDAPAGAVEPVADVIDTQDYLLKAVHRGDAVELRRLHDLPTAADETPPYGIFHGDRPIGQVSQRFRRDLWRLLKRNPSFRVEQWPYRITGAFVDCVETVVGFVSTTQRLAMGAHGVWLAPRLCGLGRFDWTHAKCVPEGQLNT